MNISYSQDVLQKLKLQQKKLEQDKTPQKLISNNSFILRTHYLGSRQTPKQITYNEIIHDGQAKKKGRYKLRNCRQPILKVQQRVKQRAKASSLLGLKQLMKQQMQRYSVKKRYDSMMQKYPDNQITQKLKLDLLFLPYTTKVPHKNRYRPNRLLGRTDNIISVNGNKIQDKNDNIAQSMINNDYSSQLMQYPDSPKRTAGFELKYKRNYLNKKIQAANIVQQLQKRPQVHRHHHRWQQFAPLTGWQ